MASHVSARQEFEIRNELTYHVLRKIEIDLVWLINIEGVNSPITDWYSEDPLKFQKLCVQAVDFCCTYKVMKILHVKGISEIGFECGRKCLESLLEFPQIPTVQTIIDAIISSEILPGTKSNSYYKREVRNSNNEYRDVFRYIAKMDLERYLEIFQNSDIYNKYNSIAKILIDTKDLNVLKDVQLEDFKFYFFIKTVKALQDEKVPTINNFLIEKENIIDITCLGYARRLQKEENWFDRIEVQANSLEEIDRTKALPYIDNQFKEQHPSQTSKKRSELPKNPVSISNLIAELKRIDDEIYQTLIERQRIIENKILERQSSGVIVLGTSS